MNNILTNKNINRYLSSKFFVWSGAKDPSSTSPRPWGIVKQQQFHPPLVDWPQRLECRNLFVSLGDRYSYIIN